MTARLRTLIAPSYLLLCLFLGGSAQGTWRNAILQLVGVVLIAWAAIERPSHAPSRPSRQLAWIVGLGIGWAIVQLVPLPFSAWSGIGPRSDIAETIRLAGFSGGWMTLSLDPYQGFAALLALIPPIAIYCSIERLHAYRAAYLVAALTVGTLAGILLGTFQVSAGDGAQSAFYLFSVVNVGKATGFFANSNHMANLLLVSLPFLAAVARSAMMQEKRSANAIAIAAGACALLIAAGLALNGSLAGFVLVVPVSAASILIAFHPGKAVRRAGAIVTVIALLTAAIALTRMPLSTADGNGHDDPALSRVAISQTTVAAITDYMPLGSGLGTYTAVYPTYEDPAAISLTRSSHAHDDYLELALELGLPFVFPLLLFLYWWGRAAVDSWLSPETSPYVRAAIVASAAILAHSIVDFPLRTGAISAIFALCLAFIADRVKSDRTEPNILRPTRHLSLD